MIMLLRRNKHFLLLGRQTRSEHRRVVPAGIDVRDAALLDLRRHVLAGDIMLRSVEILDCRCHRSLRGRRQKAAMIDIGGLCVRDGGPSGLTEQEAPLLTLH